MKRHPDKDRARDARASPEARTLRGRTSTFRPRAEAGGAHVRPAKGARDGNPLLEASCGTRRARDRPADAAHGRGERFPYGEPIGDRRGLDDPDSLARPVGLEEPDRDAGPRGPDGLAKSLAACEVCGDGRREGATRPLEVLLMAEP